MASKDNFIIELEHLFYEINQLISSEKHKCLKDGISWSQIWVLKQLEIEKKKISDLADDLGVSVPAITGLSDKLINQGLAERIRSESDRRIVYLVITEKGTAILEEIREERQKLMKVYFDGLSEEDLTHLIKIYHQVKGNILNKRQQR